MVFVIADAGVNHCGRLDYALHLIQAAADAGVDAVKFQAFDPTRQSPLDWSTRAMLKGLALTEVELKMCAAESRHKGIEFMATAFDEQWLVFVVGLGVKRLKIGSGQVKDRAFLGAHFDTGLPVIISNGMCNEEELGDALAILGAGTTVLSCVSKYPTPDTDISVADMVRLRSQTGYAVGLSSHCRSFWPCVAAAYAGASVLEVHVKLDESHVGPDMSSSLLPVELAAMVREVRNVPGR